MLVCYKIVAYIKDTNARKLESLQNLFQKLLCGQNCERLCLPCLTDRRKMMASKLYRKYYPIIFCHKSSFVRNIISAVTTSHRHSSFSSKAVLQINNSFQSSAYLSSCDLLRRCDDWHNFSYFYNKHFFFLCCVM